MIIHQIYGIFNDGKNIRDIEPYRIATEKTKAFCKKHKIRYKMWNLKDCVKLLNTHFRSYKKLWKDFRYDIQRADFIRYCILYKYGGIYVDCDIYPTKSIKHLFNMDYFFVIYPELNHIYNALIGSKPNNELFINIMEECKRSTYEKQKQEIYKTWKGRLVFQTTGQYMLKRVLKNDKNILDIISVKNRKKKKDYKNKHELFMDFNASEWWYKMNKRTTKKK